MADTQRTRAQILALFADNVTGQISAQDLRDFVVTLMEEEFVNAGDFWKKPDVKETTTDATGRGWKDYSCIVGEDCSFMNVMFLNLSGNWCRADVADSTKNGLLALAMDSYTSDDSQCIMLRRGIVYYSTWCAHLSGYIGRPIYLDSGAPGSMSLGETANSVLIIGWPETSGGDNSAGVGRWRFDPTWAIKGV